MRLAGRTGILIEAVGKRVHLAAVLAVLAGCMLVPAAPFAVAQLTTADITGTVTDAQGAALPGATVTLTNLGTKETRVAKSNGSGDYVFTLLLPGHYSVKV